MAKKKERKIPEVLVFTDVNNYPDSLASLVVLAYLADKNLITIKGIITELGTFEVRRRRAMYAKGAMSFLGHPFVRVVPGGDYELVDEEVENHYLESELNTVFERAGMTILRSGTLFLQEYIKSVKDKNIVLLFNAPFADFGKYLTSTHGTIQKKVKKIVIMGKTLPQKDARGYYVPNAECFNFKPCAEAAKALFDYVQDNNIRTTVVSSEAVKELQMDWACLENIEKSKNPVYTQLMLLHKESNPSDMAYDMVSALALVDGLFKASGGQIEKLEENDKNISFARLVDANLMKQKFCEIFKEKLETKKISLDHLKRPLAEESKEQSNA
ncbi:MAG: hypothetical protein IJS26_03965 [Alphaproteobacteria bacterium]|nr:hypothetical protein [Alphaproteobacteria bacterium]